MSRYISNHEYVKDFHNDLWFKKICPEVKQSLQDGGLDERLSNHVASLFIRCPIPVYEKELAFPCCSQEVADEIIDKIAQTPPKIKKSSSFNLNKD